MSGMREPSRDESVQREKRDDANELLTVSDFHHRQEVGVQ